MSGSAASTGPKSSSLSSCPLSCCLQVPGAGGQCTPRDGLLRVHLLAPLFAFRTLKMTPSRRGQRAVLGVRWVPGSTFTWFHPWDSLAGSTAWPVYRGGTQRFREMCSPPAPRKATRSRLICTQSAGLQRPAVHPAWGAARASPEGTAASGSAEKPTVRFCRETEP